MAHRKILVSVPDRPTFAVIGAGAAVLLALDEPGTISEVTTRIEHHHGPPTDGSDPGSRALEAIDQLRQAGAITIQQPGPA